MKLIDGHFVSFSSLIILQGFSFDSFWDWISTSSFLYSLNSSCGTCLWLRGSTELLRDSRDDYWVNCFDLLSEIYLRYWACWMMYSNESLRMRLLYLLVEEDKILVNSSIRSTCLQISFRNWNARDVEQCLLEFMIWLRLFAPYLNLEHLLDTYRILSKPSIILCRQ